MMRNFKKVLAVVCSVSLMASSAITAFATDPTSTAGTANVLAYSIESVVVPTSIKIALNPAEYTVTVRESGDATTSTAQIVTFNYGIANKSTSNKVVNVQLKVTGSADAEKTPITFVDTEAEAQAYNAESNATGAKAGELKMYLAVVGSKAAPTTLAGDDFEVTEVDGANTENASATNLCDVDMENATSGAAVFAKDETDYALAKTAFSLGKATYDVQDDLTIDFTTTQEQLASKMEITALGDVTGFTIVGAMNKDADWTKADVTALSFAPIYSVTDATGEEEEAGGYKQIKVEAAAPATDDYVMTSSEGGYTYSFIEVPTGSLTAVKVDEVSKDKAITNNLVTYADGVLTLTSTFVTNNSLTSASVVKVTIGGTEYTMVIPE